MTDISRYRRSKESIEIEEAGVHNILPNTNSDDVLVKEAHVNYDKLILTLRNNEQISVSLNNLAGDIEPRDKSLEEIIWKALRTNYSNKERLIDFGININDYQIAHIGTPDTEYNVTGEPISADLLDITEIGCQQVGAFMILRIELRQFPWFKLSIEMIRSN